MTVDEALAREKELTDHCKFEEIEKDRQRSYDCGYDVGYSKAIDDLLGRMNQITYNCQHADELFEKICDLAELLKEQK